MGSNGLTSARHDVFNKYLSQKYPESFDSVIPEDLVYSGSKNLIDPSEVKGVDIGKLVLSPTRTYAPIIKKILEKYRSFVHGMIHCSGGAQTKVLNFANDIKIIKDNLFPVSPLFKLIQEESQTPWQEMYKVFNMGHRMEIYAPQSMANEIIQISKEFHVDARVVGYCEQSKGKSLTIKTEFGEFEY